MTTLTFKLITAIETINKKVGNISTGGSTSGGNTSSGGSSGSNTGGTGEDLSGINQTIDNINKGTINLAYQTLCRKQLGAHYQGTVGWNSNEYFIKCNVNADETIYSITNTTTSTYKPSNVVIKFITLNSKDYPLIAIQFTDATTAELYYKDVTCSENSDIIAVLDSNIVTSEEDLPSL